ncbi:MAG TPA: Gfo/Idh/MocA family oxidoreductase [Bryobacteraceae bacterium]|nr:Gfo/Idh/MocA family oxidoreductase [Bryobacteraceae bacterium]
MSQPLEMGIIGVGRMGGIHARHLLELEREGMCRLCAIVDVDAARLKSYAAEVGFTGPLFTSIDEYIAAKLCEATMVVAPTEHHRAHAMALARAGHRVLMEKPLTGTLEGDVACCTELDRDYPLSVMLAFQRRYDAALGYGKELVQQGAIGRMFKIYSALEDSGPPPDGYQSGGILPDMSVHNVDEILWLAGRMPDRAMAVGSVLHNKHVASCKEDFDDAMLYMWFGEELLGQVQVTRNHVSGYRVETAIYGDQGQIQIGHFDQRPHEIVVEAFGRRGRSAPIVRKVFPGGNGSAGAPEFVDRFGPAYKAEAAAFIDCCRRGVEFPMTHRDGLRAQQVIAAGMRAVKTREDGAVVAA